VGHEASIEKGLLCLLGFLTDLLETLGSSLLDEIAQIFFGVLVPRLRWGVVKGFSLSQDPPWRLFVDVRLWNEFGAASRLVSREALVARTSCLDIDGGTASLSRFTHV